MRKDAYFRVYRRRLRARGNARSQYEHLLQSEQRATRSAIEFIECGFRLIELTGIDALVGLAVTPYDEVAGGLTTLGLGCVAGAYLAFQILRNAKPVALIAASRRWLYIAMLIGTAMMGAAVSTLLCLLLRTALANH